MGTWFTTLHLHAADRPLGELQSACHALLRELLLAEDYVEIEDLEEADRILYVGPGEGTAWLTVYDSLMPQIDDMNCAPPNALTDFACLLAGKLDTVALGIGVADSDLFGVYLCQGDRLLQLPICPRSSGAEAVRTTFRGTVLEQLHIRIDEHSSPEDRMWGRRYAAEDCIDDREIIELLWEYCGLDPQWSSETEFHLGDELLMQAGFLRLAFRSTRPIDESILLHDESSPTELTPVDDRLENGGVASISPIVLRVGEPVNALAIELINENGGPSTGLSVAIEGAAIDQGLVQIDGMSVLTTFNPDQRIEMNAPLQPAELDKRPIQMAHFNELSIPPGLPFVITDDSQARALTEARRRIRIIVRPLGTATQPGEGTLILRIIPHGNRRNGRVRIELPIRVEGEEPSPNG